MSNETFKQGEETYGDVPSGGGIRGFIGYAKSVQRWDCGWITEDQTINGVEYHRGNVYVKGTKEDARNVAEALGKKFSSAAMLITVPIASVTNMDDDNKTKFASGFVQAAARIVGMKSKHMAGLNLVTLPSVVDAYARLKGWYIDPLFDISVLDGVDKVEDANYVCDTLTEMRKSIWKALGEEDYTKTHDETKSEKLKEALKAVYMSSWEGWVRVYMTFNPESGDKGAFYTKDDGSTDRRRVPAVTQFFKGEKDAIEAGKAELAQFSQTESPNGKASVADYAVLYDKLSKRARDSYKPSIWPEIASDIVRILRTGKPVMAVAKEYEIDKADVELVKNAK